MSRMPSMELSNGAVDFIDETHLFGLLAGKRPSSGRVREIIAKSLAKEALSAAETASSCWRIHLS